MASTRHYVKENKATVENYKKMTGPRKLTAFNEEDDLMATWKKVDAQIEEKKKAFLESQIVKKDKNHK